MFTIPLVSPYYNEKNILKNLFENNPNISTAQMNAIYTDPYYGLQHEENWIKWDSLVSTTPKLANRLFKNELKTYFNLSETIVNIAEKNWDAEYKAQLIAVSSPPIIHYNQSVYGIN
jgi:tRNA G10  N-methylase Trm11